MNVFQPHTNLADPINRRIVASEIEGGVYLSQLPGDTVLAVDTVNRSYQVRLSGPVSDNGGAPPQSRDFSRADLGNVWISGHPKYCPEPVAVRLRGSNWGGSMLKSDYLGRGMRMEFHHPGHGRTIVTSRIVDIRIVS